MTITIDEIKACHLRQGLHMDGPRDYKSGWWADIHICIEQPRLRRKTTFKRADRSVKTEWSVDGRDWVATLEEAVAALNGPVLPPNEPQYVAMQEMRKRLDKESP